MQKEIKREVKIDRHNIILTNQQRILFPGEGITKGDLVTYYEKIAPYMLPYVHNRLMSVQRYPQGIRGEGFFQKNVPPSFPSWIKKMRIGKQEDGSTNYVICNNAATLVYLANYGCIVLHIALSKVDKLLYPDRMIFDLDPSEGVSFAKVKWAAFALKEVLESFDLVPFAMPTGSRGIHVVVPLKRNHHFEKVEEFAHKCARLLVTEYPNRLTLAFYKKSRGARIFVDTLRNQYGATAVAPYSVRARKGAPIALPLSWSELEKVRSADYYTMKKTLQHLEKHGDAWHDMPSYARSLNMKHVKQIHSHTFDDEDVLEERTGYPGLKI